jgi:hypothetical protein
MKFPEYPFRYSTKDLKLIKLWGQLQDFHEVVFVWLVKLGAKAEKVRAKLEQFFDDPFACLH